MLEAILAMGLAGPLVSVLVGVTTSVLAERRSRRTRLQLAREMIVHDLGRLVAEGELPDGDTILAMMRSAMREQRAGSPGAGLLEEVMEDLQRQIASDPFLEARRRNELLKIATRANESTRSVMVARRVEFTAVQRVSGVSILLGLTATVTGLVALYSFSPAVTQWQTLPDDMKRTLAIGGGGLAVLVLLMTVTLTRSAPIPKRKRRKA